MLLVIRQWPMHLAWMSPVLPCTAKVATSCCRKLAEQGPVIMHWILIGLLGYHHHASEMLRCCCSSSNCTLPQCLKLDHSLHTLSELGLVTMNSMRSGCMVGMVADAAESVAQTGGTGMAAYFQ